MSDSQEMDDLVSYYIGFDRSCVDSYGISADKRFSEILPKKAVFKCFLIHFPGQRADFRLQHVIHFLNAYASAVNLGYLGTFLVHPTRRQNLAGNLYLVLCNI